MKYNLVLLSKKKSKERARGPARFIIRINKNPIIDFGILYIDSAKHAYDSIVAHKDNVDIDIYELTESELIGLLMKGWRMRS